MLFATLMYLKAFHDINMLILTSYKVANTFDTTYANSMKLIKKQREDFGV